MYGNRVRIWFKDVLASEIKNKRKGCKDFIIIKNPDDFIFLALTEGVKWLDSSTGYFEAIPSSQILKIYVKSQPEELSLLKNVVVEPLRTRNNE